MEVYSLFETRGEGDGYRIDILLGIFASVELAKAYCISLNNDEYDDEYYFEYNKPVHESMNDTNSHIYIGKRDDCNELCNYDRFGGYVIEKNECNRSK
jgi:hypothetical protein